MNGTIEFLFQIYLLCSMCVVYEWMEQLLRDSVLWQYIRRDISLEEPVQKENRVRLTQMHKSS